MSPKQILSNSKLSSALTGLILLLTSCSQPLENKKTIQPDPPESNKSSLPKRLIVLKTFKAYGDYEERDANLVTQLCIEKLKGSITQKTFESKYGDLDVRLISGPAIKYNAQTQIDERRKVTEQYTENISVPTYLDGVAMNDGKRATVRRSREVVKGKIRHIYAQCTAFEYHF